MKKRVRNFSLAIIGISIFVASIIWLQVWLTKPNPISLDSPEAQQIKDVVIRSRKIEAILFCVTDTDVNMLDEVYLNTSDYKLSKYDKILINRYLGDEYIENGGYLNFIKAYHLWDRTTDPYPTATTRATGGVRLCPDPYGEPKLTFLSISLREDKAIVLYNSLSYRTEAILRKNNGVWFIVSSRNLAILV